MAYASKEAWEMNTSTSICFLLSQSSWLEFGAAEGPVGKTDSCKKHKIRTRLP